MPSKILLALISLLAWAQPSRATDVVPSAPSANIRSPVPTNLATGETLLPVGRNFVGARSGTLYVPAGPKGVIDPSGGRFMPIR